MIYSHEVETMCPVAQGVNHGAAPIPEEAKWDLARYNKVYSEGCGLAFNVTFCVFALIQAFKFKKGNMLKTLYIITAGLFAIAFVLDIIKMIF